MTYRKHIEVAAKAHGVDPDLLEALVIEVILERVPPDQRQGVVASVTNELLRIMPVPYSHDQSLPQRH